MTSVTSTFFSAGFTFVRGSTWAKAKPLLEYISVSAVMSSRRRLPLKLSGGNLDVL